MQHQARIHTHPETRKKSLIVYYDQVADDFMERIADAEKLHRVKPGSMVIIAKPIKALTTAIDRYMI